MLLPEITEIDLFRKVYPMHYRMGKSNMPQQRSVFPASQKKNPTIYFTATNRIQLTKMNLINLAGKYFCVLAPKYIPAKPPIPNNNPRVQSGDMTISG